uniref:Teneurin-1 n=1 Tax=Rhabditophanes sp. KR3021 TaxID=114890 RepID=A0AC35TJA7_9BILA
MHSIYARKNHKDFPLRGSLVFPLPHAFSLGEEVTADLPPGRIVYTQFHVSKPSTINFNISIGSRAKVVLYLRETALPTPAVNDFRRVILADRLHLVSGKRSVDRSNLRSTLFSYLLLAGKWNLAFLNDGDQLQPLTLIATVSGQFNGPFESPSFDVSPLLTDSDTCKFDCSNKGKCKGGKCECFPGYDGFYCETSSCPILCSGNGVYLNGQCMCHDNYKGPECDIPSSWCSVPDCNGHGECGRNGKCSCRSGWSGEYCDQKTCVNGCSNNGICSSEGKCYCSNGYFGETCHKSIRDLGSDKVNKTVYKSDPKPVQIIPTEPSTTKNKFCSERGVYESSFGTCKCDKGFKGNYCEILGCTVDCGVHGTCVDGNTCQCHDDYEGDFCEKKSCLPTCHLNGICQEDGSCQCNNGFNGEDCSIEGCPQSCHGNGNCEKVNSVWTCICDKDHQGSENCQFRFGEVCDDGLDNDNDGLIDCEDSTECCGHPSCASESLCNNIPKPSELAVRSNKSGMSFYEQYKFLIAPNSVQYYVKEQSFVEKRVSVVRGRVFSIKAGPLSGVRVSEESNGYSGFTLTRTKNETGYFDILVNGGGIISLRFMRPQFARTYKNVYVGINEVVYIGDVYLDESQNQKAAPTKECKDYLKHHDISPIIIPYWSLSQYSAYPPNHSNPVLFAESLSILDSIALQGSTDLKLVYYSDRTPTSFSHIFLQLIDSQTPVNIKNVHVKTTVAGTTYQTTLQAKPNLRYTFNWNKQDSYKQAVYGFVGINIDVGYEYKDCPVIVWTNSSHLIEGHQLSNLTMGGWQLSNHHHYDYLNNILERGDGKRLQLGEDERMVENFVGNENQRESKCFFCNSQKIEEALFYEPREIVFSKDGTLLIGDHNLIRMVNFETGIISPILELPNTEADHSYFLAADPLSGTLIVSIPYKRQVIQISEFEEEMDLKKLVSNFDVLAGNGNSCAPEDPCGDYSDPKSAQLTFPKGVAVDGNGRKFVIDSRKLRSISKDGESIKTLISEKPIHPGKSNCRVAFDFEEVAFDWPTSIAIDYKSGFLFVLDVEIIYKLDLVNEVAYVYAGCRKECCGVANNNVLLLSARSIAVSEKENRLFVSEGDGKKVNQIRSFSLNYDTAKAIDLVVGKEGKCDCDKKNCPCDDKFATSASQAGLNNPSGIAFDLSGQMFIADQGNFKIKILRQFKPNFDKKKQVYKVNYPELNEMYTFDVNGQHLSTTSINTAKPIYTFKYLDSKLSQIELTGRKAIEISYNKEEILLEAPSNFKTKLELKDKCLVSVTNPDKTIINLRYSSQGQLIKKKANEKTWTFNYDSITNTPLSIISPAGQNYSVSDQILTSNGFSTNVLLNGQLFTTILIELDEDEVIKKVSFGKNSVNFKYDVRGRLLTISHSASNKLITRLGYSTKDVDISFRPVVVQMASGDKFRWKFDGFGNVLGLKSPLGEDHKFWKVSSNLPYDYTRLYRQGPHLSAEKAFLMILDANEKVTAVITPDSEKMLYIERDVWGNVMNMFVDDKVYAFQYKDGSKVNITISSDSVKKRALNMIGNLVTKQVDTYQDISTSIEYEYDGGFRVISRKFIFNKAVKDIELIKYDSQTGKILIENEFGKSVVVRNNERMVVSEDFSLYSKPFIRVEYEYDNLGRVSTIQWFNRGNKLALERREYGINGELVKYVVGGNDDYRFNEPLHWNIEYDLDCRVRAINEKIIYKENGVVKLFDGLTYENENGWIVRRGNWNFKYDVLGRIVIAKIQHKEIYYDYDENGKIWRRIVKSGTQTFEQIQYWYDEKGRLKYFWNYREFDNIWSIKYDVNTGRVKSLSQNEDIYYIVTDIFNSIKFVIGNHGELVNEIIYSPFGRILTQNIAKPYYMPLGYRGNFEDEDLGIIFVEEYVKILNMVVLRPLDVNSGRFMSSSPKILEQECNLLEPNLVADIFGYSFAGSLPSIKYDFYDWMRMSGYNYNFLQTQLDMYKDSELACPPNLVTLSSSLCEAFSKTRPIYEIESFPIVNIMDDVNKKFTTKMFGNDERENGLDFVMIADENKYIRSINSFSSFESRETQNIRLLIENCKMIESKDFFIFNETFIEIDLIKKIPDQFKKDSEIASTMGKVALIDSSFPIQKITIYRGQTKLTIYYTQDEESFLKAKRTSFYQQMVAKKWESEKKAIQQSNMFLGKEWSKEEIAKIFNKGSVKTVTIRPKLKTFLSSLSNWYFD